MTQDELGAESNVWRVLNQSVLGTSHARDGDTCQDAEEVARAGGNVLILICSDGAGSATHSARGSRLACRAAMRVISAALANGFTFEGDEALDAPLHWAEQVHDCINEVAEAEGLVSRDFACTLLLAVLGESHSIFLQLGDGAIVTSNGSSIDVVFWPDRGEYANATWFITDKRSIGRVQIARTGRVEEVALFTDGLQSIALDYSTKRAHPPFFLPMFRALRAVASSDELQVALKRFLDSPPVNERTDDDKTLILATRLPPPPI